MERKTFRSRRPAKEGCGGEEAAVVVVAVVVVVEVVDVLRVGWKESLVRRAVNGRLHRVRRRGRAIGAMLSEDWTKPGRSMASGDRQVLSFVGEMSK